MVAIMSQSECVRQIISLSQDQFSRATLVVKDPYLKRF